MTALLLPLLLAMLVAPAAPLGNLSETGQDEPSPIAAAIAKADAALDAIAEVPAPERTYANTVLALDDLVATFFQESRMTGFMAQVSTSAEERARGQRASEDSGDWWNRMGKREDVYRAIKAYAATNPELEGEQRRFLEQTLRDFRREGLELGEDERARLLEIGTELNKLSIEFSQNIRDDETAVLLMEDELNGVPAEFLASLDRIGELYLCRTTGPVMTRIFQLCDVESTRLKMASAASLRGGSKNVTILEKILALRHEKAKLLGFAHTADYETEVKMTKDAATVWGFYEDLKPKLRRKALQDFEEFQTAKREHTGDPEAKLESWDISFYKNRLMRTKYAVDSEQVREYFPMENVFRGLFATTQTLFGVEYKDITERARAEGRPIWHEDVKLFEVWDQATKELLGEFYTDLHPRPNKYNHAAQFPLVLRKKWSDGTVTKPLVALVCNFSKPTEGKPALLSHDEVETFFHEFGHCLHSILTRAELANFAGTNVARDFVEAPSQMLENWIWDAGVLATFAKHYETGASFPNELLSGLIAAKKLGSGLAAEGQVFLGTMDMRYHTDEDGIVDTTAVRAEVYRETRLFEPLDNLIGQASFNHLMGYQAGYYGYLWSLVYAQDMFSRFKQDGLMNPKTAQAYRAAVLARGGTVDELDMVREFLGREPNADAFLEHLGLNSN